MDIAGSLAEGVKAVETGNLGQGAKAANPHANFAVDEGASGQLQAKGSQGERGRLGPVQADPAVVELAVSSMMANPKNAMSERECAKFLGAHEASHIATWSMQARQAAPEFDGSGPLYGRLMQRAAAPLSAQEQKSVTMADDLNRKLGEDGAERWAECAADMGAVMALAAGKGPGELNRIAESVASWRAGNARASALEATHDTSEAVRALARSFPDGVPADMSPEQAYGAIDKIASENAAQLMLREGNVAVDEDLGNEIKEKAEADSAIAQQNACSADASSSACRAAVAQTAAIGSFKGNLAKFRQSREAAQAPLQTGPKRKLGS